MSVRKNASQLSLNVHLPESHPQEATVRKHHQDVDRGQIGHDFLYTTYMPTLVIFEIMRTRAGSGAGFELDDEEHNEIRKRITDIHTLGEILDDQMALGNWEWLERVVPKLRSATQLAQETTLNASIRRTPRTYNLGRERAATRHGVGMPPSSRHQAVAVPGVSVPQLPGALTSSVSEARHSWQLQGNLRVEYKRFDLY
ncbi:hypothetical protein BC629DRAFT_1443001 [Irpex lacteus]|nr:hypothetical protein BC629DRAFT_1443001 [Irpex lacteus]